MELLYFGPQAAEVYERCMLPRSSCVCVFRIIGSTTLSTKVWKASGSVLTLKWSKGMCMKNPHAMQISYVDLRAAVQTPIVKPSHTSAPCTERWNYLRSLLWEMFARRKCEWRHLQDKTLHCEIRLPFRRVFSHCIIAHCFSMTASYFMDETTERR